MRVERLTLDEWRDALPNSGFEVFHTPEALSVLGSHAAGDLELYGGFKGQQPVGLFPVFVRRRSYGTVVTSPPPFLGARLGPIVMSNSPKQRKREKLNRRFTEAVLSALNVTSPKDENGAESNDLLPDAVRSRITGQTTLFRAACNVDYADPRPYVWNGLHATPQFTYQLDVETPARDDLLMSFSKSLRREIRDGEELDISVETEGVDGAREIYRDLSRRYDEQGESFGLDWDFVRELVVELDDRSRVYVTRGPDGAYISGIIALYSNDAAYFWLGGTRGTYDGVGVNGRLHWRIITDLYEDDELNSISTYDLHGANNANLCRYKSKFGGTLTEYYVVESSGVEMQLAKGAYKLISRYR